MEVPNENYELKDGITAELFIPTAEVKGHLIPPSSLTLNEEGLVGVRHIDQEGRAKFSKVTIIGDEGESVWITGLPEKVLIIVVGHEFVSNGEKIKYRLEDSKI